MKVLAMYLPQFHRTPENDTWWGEGYTEWTAVKRAKPLFDGHYQPHVPLDGYYYDLMQKSTMEWQASLMHKYGVDGMCFYHYYFKDGRKILEKPAENLLDWRDIDMPFCFAWANESWVRTWSNIGGNSWNVYEEDGKGQKGNGILLAQEYGGEKEWREHFEYLLPFFHDERYIKKEGKPVFIIYRAEDISCINGMMSLWNDLAKENGYEGVFFIEVNSRTPGFDGCIIKTPNSFGLERQGLVENYDKESECIIANAVKCEESSYLCGVPSYDDTPRRGKSGFAITGSTPDKFYDQIRKLLYISDKRKLDYVFINAWNEWGEGMYLEPDCKFGYGYLEALSKARKDYGSLQAKEIDALMDSGHHNTDIDGGLSKKIRKYRSHYMLLNKWMMLKEQDKTLGAFFSDNEFRKVAVYGIGILGKHLLSDLKNIDGIELVYGIDRTKDTYIDLTLYHPDQDLPPADVIVVSPIDEYDEIYKSLKRCNIKVVSLEEIINYCLQ